MSNYITIFARDLLKDDVVNTPSGVFQVKSIDYSEPGSVYITWKLAEKEAPFSAIPNYWSISVELTDKRKRLAVMK